VISRIYNKHNIKKVEIKLLISNFISLDRPGDFTEALMDLGAKVCKARDPNCKNCPLNTICKTYLENKSALLKKTKLITKKKIRYGNCYIISRDIDQKYFFIRRPLKGLLGGMLSFPSSDWREDKNNLENEELFEGLIIRNQINKPINIITHTFSHFKLILDIYVLKIIDSIDIEGEWIELDEAFTELPSLMKKVAHTV